MAQIVLNKAIWPSSDYEAALVIMGYFRSASTTHVKKLALMKRLGVNDTKFGLPLAIAEEKAAELTQAALSELLLIGALEVRGLVETSRTRMSVETARPYWRTNWGMYLLGNLCIARRLEEEGWPTL